MSGWDPEQYLRFREERRRPFFDLLDLVQPIEAARVVDLGCGTGETTGLLHERLSARSTIGVDASAEMLAKSAQYARDGVEFEHADIGEFCDRHPRAFDLVFSNAALHWMRDHPALLAKLTKTVARGGQLAVQVPDNFSWHSHQAAREVAAEPPFADQLTGSFEFGVLRPEEYAKLLHELGYADQNVHLRVYPHVLPNRQAAVEWAKGSYLTPYRRQLDAAAWDAFIARYAEVLFARLDAAVDDEPLFFPYRRLFVWGRR